MEHVRYNSNFEDLKGDFSVTYSDTKAAPKSNFHIHEAFEIMLVLSDQIEVSVNDEVYIARYGSVLLFNTMDLHKIRYTGSDSYKRIVLWFKPEFLSELGSIGEKLLGCFYRRGQERANLITPQSEEFDELISLFNKMQKTSLVSFKDLHLKLLLCEILTFINEISLKSKEGASFSESSEYASVYKAIRYIQENFSESIDQSKLARLVGLDKRALCNEFKRHTGFTTGQYILSCRITSAKALLVRGFSVSEVCERTGFSNWSNFSRTFKNHVGLSPKQYAMKHSSP